MKSDLDCRDREVRTQRAAGGTKLLVAVLAGVLLLQTGCTAEQDNGTPTTAADEQAAVAAVIPASVVTAMGLASLATVVMLAVIHTVATAAATALQNADFEFPAVTADPAWFDIGGYWERLGFINDYGNQVADSAGIAWWEAIPQIPTVLTQDLEFVWSVATVPLEQLPSVVADYGRQILAGPTGTPQLDERAHLNELVAPLEQLNAMAVTVGGAEASALLSVIDGTMDRGEARIRERNEAIAAAGEALQQERERCAGLPEEEQRDCIQRAEDAWQGAVDGANQAAAAATQQEADRFKAQAAITRAKARPDWPLDTSGKCADMLEGVAEILNKQAWRYRQGMHNPSMPR